MQFIISDCSVCGRLHTDHKVNGLQNHLFFAQSRLFLQLSLECLHSQQQGLPVIFTVVSYIIKIYKRDPTVKRKDSAIWSLIKKKHLSS